MTLQLRTPTTGTTLHVPYDAQLQSDIETVARNVSPGLVRRFQNTAELCPDVAKATKVTRGLPGRSVLRQAPTT